MFKRLLLIFVLLTLSMQSFAGATPWIDFTLDNGHIKIPVEVSGKSAYAILDTGANINGINSSFIEAHQFDFDRGQSITLQGAYGTEKRKTFNNIPTKLFGIDIQMDDMVEVGLGSKKNALIIGAGFFQKFIVQLDYPNSKMRLIQRDALDMVKLKNIDMSVQKGSGMPIVKVDINGEKSAWVLFDTGSTGGLTVERSFARKQGWLEKYQTEQGYSAGVNTVKASESFRIDLLKFGPFELENILVNVPAEGESSNLATQFEGTTGSRIRGRSVKGLLGYDILKHFLITIDYKRGYAHIGLPE